MLVRSLSYRVVTLLAVIIFTLGVSAVSLTRVNAVVDTSREASDVLGQPDLDTADTGLSATELDNPTGVAMDEVNHRLFVADGNNERVLVFNLNGSNELVNKTADYVLGQEDFTSNGSNTTADGFDLDDGGVVFDEVNNRLFVSDESNYRVLVFDTTTITNGEDAVAVLGQDDFTSSDSDLTADRFDYNESTPAYDQNNQLLYVPEYDNDRVMIFDVENITNGEDAVNVLGAPDFTTDNGGTAQDQMSLEYVGSVFDQTTERFYVSDEDNNRVLVYDMSSITDGEPAINVLGQEDFTSSSSDTDADGMDTPGALAIDRDNQMLFVSDKNNYRIMIFDVNSITDGQDAVGVIGQPDLETVDSPAGPSATTVDLDDSTGMFFSESTDTLFVAEQGNDRVSIWADPYDEDGVEKYDEDNAPNDGDGNDDGIKDSYQENVASLPNEQAEDDGAYITIETSGCLGLRDTSVRDETDSGDDEDYEYPLGLLGFNAECESNGDSADVTIYFDKEYDTTDWKARKSILGEYSDIDDATFGTAVVGSDTVTTLSYTVEDGGPLDADGLANGTIDDPVGPAVLGINSPDTGREQKDSTLALVSILLGLSVLGYVVHDRRRRTTTSSK